MHRTVGIRQTTWCILFFAFTLAGCSASRRGSAGPVAVPGRAVLQIIVEPNPIVAQHVSGNTYDFPFEIGIAERGGVPVEIQRVGISAGLGGINMYSRAYNRDEIVRRGYPTSLPANGEVRYKLSPRQQVPNESLFSVASAEMFAEGTDGNGNPVRATTRVTLSRN